MKKTNVIAVIALAVSAAVLAGCTPRSAMSTLSAASDSETAEVFSLTKVLDLGTNYLVSLDYENAILQYIDIIQHDPQNKAAYAGLYVAYAANGEADKASEVFSKAQEVFEDEAEFIPEFLKDADLVYKNGGGNSPYQVLSNYYWDDINSIFAKDISDAWRTAEPGNAEAYALLGAYYAAQDNDAEIEKLLSDAEEDGIDLNMLNSEIKTNSDGTYTLTLQIDGFMEEKEKEASSIKVQLNSNDNAKTATQKVAEKAADSAASKVVEDSGLTGEAASIANSMAQEALRKGLGSLGSSQSAGSSSSIAASSNEPAQPDDSDGGFDWSELESEFQAIKDDLAS